MSEILIIYQDCPMCGSRKAWGEKTIEAINKAGKSVRKVSCFSMEGQSHALNAIAQGITTFPFVTDGKTYAKDVESVLEAKSEAHTSKKSQRKTKKSKKQAKEAKNGTDSES